ncbi:uncharacterized protein LOC126775303 [Nymphalis io]|uniref:uncharacterized protein LOC126775303 n=1 Tax=Inachis io TaxID=171585 RepID=UPI002166D0F4|nr:uncharacterized protein LOC126775303 [Nymphalis io]XP_050353095.1 uncharacterized protein LOC126775303 [Nymphalis io]
MGQEQSFITQANVAPVKKYQDKYDDTIQYRVSPIDYRTSDYDRKDYRRHRARSSAESFKSDNSSTESSGYRSGSSAYECRSERSSNSDYYCTSLYKNNHYKDINKELYKPVKIPKDKRYKQLFDDKDENKSGRLQGYLSETEKAKLKAGSTAKKAGIRNYTPKIISAEEQRKKIENWI